jgi:hypothetical protein
MITDDQAMNGHALSRSFTTLAWLSLYNLSSLVGFALVLLVSWRLIDSRPPGVLRYSGEILLVATLTIWSAILLLFVMGVRDLVRSTTGKCPLFMTDQFLRNTVRSSSSITRSVTALSYLFALACPLFPLAMLMVDDALYNYHSRSPLGPFQTWTAFVQYIFPDPGPVIRQSSGQRGQRP